MEGNSGFRGGARTDEQGPRGVRLRSGNAWNLERADV